MEIKASNTPQLEWAGDALAIGLFEAVSYTHLTLPTILRV